MNDSDDLLPDKLIDEALATLRSVTPPKELHEANLAAVHHALTRRIEPTWWRRSVTVPVPIAIAATVAFALTAGALLRPSMMSGEIQQVAPGPTRADLVADDSDSNIGVDDEADPSWSITRSYIHSLGNSQVFVSPDPKEKQDDS